MTPAPYMLNKTIRLALGNQGYIVPLRPPYPATAPTLDKHKTRLGFERAAHTYDANAGLQRRIGNQLISQLPMLTVQTLLDLGCGTGVIAHDLQQAYPQVHIVGLDLAFSMVKKTCAIPNRSRLSGVCADALNLPFKNHMFDLLISNLMLQWCNNLPTVFSEWRRVLSPNGPLLFSTLGPGTLYELHTSWAQVDHYNHVSPFIGVDAIKQALLGAGFFDIDIKTETIVWGYSEVYGLLRDLKGIGANNATTGRNPGLTGKQRFQDFFKAYETFRLADGQYPSTYEVIYVYAS